MKGLEMVKCESSRINIPNNHTEKSVNFPVTNANNSVFSSNKVSSSTKGSFST